MRNFLEKILILSLIVFLDGCFFNLEHVKQSKPGEASGEIVVKPSK